MGLMDKLQAGQTLPKKCVTQRLLDSLPEEENVLLGNILEKIGNNTGEFTSNWLAATLASENHRVGRLALSYHARKQCCCYATK